MNPSSRVSSSRGKKNDDRRGSYDVSGVVRERFEGVEDVRRWRSEGVGYKEDRSGSRTLMGQRWGSGVGSKNRMEVRLGRQKVLNAVSCYVPGGETHRLSVMACCACNEVVVKAVWTSVTNRTRVFRFEGRCM